jgi:hypothetical protein
MDLNKLFSDSNPNEIKKLISLLQSMVDNSSSDGDNESEDNEDEQIIKTRSQKTNTKRSKKQNNKFLSMQEMNMHKEDIEFQKRVSKHPPVPRNRGFEPLRVKCRVCGKTEEVNGALVDSVERYKCNNCASSAG